MICLYCHLETDPLQWHEGQSDCLQALKAEVRMGNADCLNSLLSELNELRDANPVLRCRLEETERELEAVHREVKVLHNKFHLGDLMRIVP